MRYERKTEKKEKIDPRSSLSIYPPGVRYCRKHWGCQCQVETKLTRDEIKDNKEKKIRELAIYMLENPGKSREEMALDFKWSYEKLCKIIRDSVLLTSIRSYASKEMLAMIPLAVKGFRDSLTTGNAKIKFLASQELLKSEKILGPERVDVTLNDNSKRTLEEMQEEIRKAQMVPPPTIDAEIIS